MSSNENSDWWLRTWVYCFRPTYEPWEDLIDTGKAESDPARFTAVAARHNEASLTIRRTLVALAIFSLFCCLALAKPDIQLFGFGSGLTLPFASAEINLFAFVLIGPLVTMALAMYAHVFIGQLKHLEFYEARRRSPVLVNLRTPAGMLLYWLWAYLLPPALVFGFAYKALRIDESWIVVGFAFAALIASIVLQIRRCSEPYRRACVPALLIGLCATLAAIGYYGYTAQSGNIFSRTPTVTKQHLTGLDLRRVDLTQFLFEGNDWAAAQLEGAILSQSPASLIVGEWEKFVGKGTDLSGKNFESANLKDAVLAWVNLQNAVLWNTDLRNAALFDSNLANASLGEADLRGASLTATDLTGARLREAKNLTQEQVDEALGDWRTLLPERLTIPAKWPTPILH